MSRNAIVKIDRQQFIDCVNGDLMTRNSCGVITQLGDVATKAVEAAERGETVALMVGGRIVSYVVEGKETAV
jgi:hypothetical protein